MNELELGGLLILVAGSFVATNLDNLILLVVLMGAEPHKRAAVALGFLCSAICILGIAAIGAAVGAGLDAGLLGYMGLVPLGMGMYLLYRRYRGDRQEDHVLDDADAAASQGAGWLSSFLLMFSNSGDSLAIFFPLLAESDRDSLLWEIALFLGMALFWTFLAWRIADQRELALRIEKVGEKLVPWVMMAAGVYILMDTATDTLH